MTKITKILAREWLTLIAGIVVGFFLIPALIYTLLSPAGYTSSHSLIDAYAELIEMLFAKKGRSDSWIAMAIILGPYCLFQFGRSVLWAIRAMKEH